MNYTKELNQEGTFTNMNDSIAIEVDEKQLITCLLNDLDIYESVREFWKAKDTFKEPFLNLYEYWNPQNYYPNSQNYNKISHYAPGKEFEKLLKNVFKFHLREYIKNQLLDYETVLQKEIEGVKTLNGKKASLENVINIKKSLYSGTKSLIKIRTRKKWRNIFLSDSLTCVYLLKFDTYKGEKIQWPTNVPMHLISKPFSFMESSFDKVFEELLILKQIEFIEDYINNLDNKGELSGPTIAAFSFLINECGFMGKDDYPSVEKYCDAVCKNYNLKNQFPLKAQQAYSDMRQRLSIDTKFIKKFEKDIYPKIDLNIKEKIANKISELLLKKQR